ncbi:MAG: hypothetical protein V3S08_01855, partial [Phycisphaerales bacterium]
VGQKQCSKSRQASTVAVATKVASKKASGCPKAAATTETLALLAKAIRTMPDDASRASVVTAYRTMAKANPDLVCEKQCASVKAVLAGGSTCGSSAKTIAVAGKSGAASGCCVSKGAKARNIQVANTAACDPAACRAAKATRVSDGFDAAAHAAACRAAKATQASNNAASAAACAAAKAKGTKVAFGGSTCSKASQARYVAFGCNKTDKLARTAARGYLDLIRELKAYSGADGCSVSTASKLLAQMIQDDSARAVAPVVVDVPVVETVSNIETPVSLGAVSDVKKSKRSQCSSSKK